MKFLLPLLLALSVAADPLPAERNAPWAGDRVGVSGGIPVYLASTNMSGLDNTGTTDVSANIQAALNSAPLASAVVLPNGTFRLASSVNVPPQIVLRGQGRTNTTLVLNNGGGIASMMGLTFGVGTSYIDDQDVTSGYTRGSSNIVLASAALYPPGQWMALDELNDTNFVNTADSQQGCGGGRECTRALGQYVQIKARSGNTLTVWPPLLFTYQSSLLPKAWIKYPVGQRSGIENLAITNPFTNATKSVYGSYISECWVKGVEISGALNRAIELVYAGRCEVRDNYIHDTTSTLPGSSSAYGIHLNARACGCWVENNYTSRMLNGVIMEDAIGNAITHNFTTNGVYFDSTYLQGSYVEHFVHCGMNLIEGNIGEMVDADNIHGSSSHTVVHRNYIIGHGSSGQVNQLRAIEWAVWSHTNSVIGCVLGDSTWSATNTFVFDGPSSPPGTRTIYRLGYWDGSSSTNNWTPAAGLTQLRQANYDYVHGATQFYAGNTNLVQSYLYSSKPTWWDTWGTTPWPPIGPDLTPMVNTLPVQLMVQTGGSPPPPPPPPPPTNLLRGATIRSAIFR